MGWTCFGKETPPEKIECRSTSATFFADKHAAVKAAMEEHRRDKLDKLWKAITETTAEVVEDFKKTENTVPFDVTLKTWAGDDEVTTTTMLGSAVTNPDTIVRIHDRAACVVNALRDKLHPFVVYVRSSRRKRDDGSEELVFELRVTVVDRFFCPCWRPMWPVKSEKLAELQRLYEANGIAS